MVFFYSACVTVNIYFPAAAVERAADQIVKETWAGPAEPGTTPVPQPQSHHANPSTETLAFSFIGVAHAQEPDINVSNPAIRALKDSIKQRSDAIKPYMDRGNVGIAPRWAFGDSRHRWLKSQRSGPTPSNWLTPEIARIREALYTEIAKANNIPTENIPKDQKHLRQKLDRTSPPRLVDPG